MKLGNLLLLSSAIISSLRNDTFAIKEETELNRDGSKFRNGYTDDSHSEIEITRNEDWRLNEIRERGIRLVKSMEKRLNIHFPNIRHGRNYRLSV